MNVSVRAEDGTEGAEITLPEAIFGTKINVPLMHQVVTAQLASARRGTHNTKTRGEVRGGGKKPWRQKGTGRARHGSIREPQWKGGGAVFGPKPRDYAPQVPKKMKAVAMRSALAAQAAEGRVMVVEDLSFDEPKTRRAAAALEAWGVQGKTLIVLAGDETNVVYAFRNLPHVHMVAEHQLNTYDVLNADTVIFVRSALDALQARVEGRAPGEMGGSGGEPPIQADEPGHADSGGPPEVTDA